MKTITNIKKISSNKYKLIIDKEAYLVYDDILIKYNLLSNKEINDEVFKNIISSQEFYDLYYKIIKFIAYKLRTETEIKRKLNSLHASKNNIQLIIDRLHSEGYLNEDMYIKCYVNDAVNLRLDGPNKIIQDLKKLNMPEDKVYKYLSNIGNDEWLAKIDKIINKRVKSNHDLSKKMLKVRLTKDLITLGYSADLYNNKLDNLDIDDNDVLKKEYDKLYLRYSRKYEGSKLDAIIRQKLYNQGFDYSDIQKDSEF